VAEPADRASIGIRYQVGARHPLRHGADGIAILATRPELADDPEPVRRARRDGHAISDGQVQPGAARIAIGSDPAAPGDVEASVGVIRLGHAEDLDVPRLLPLVRTAQESLLLTY